MGRRRASSRTGLQKLQRVKKTNDKQLERWLDTFPTRREMDEFIRIYLGQYHAAEVERLQELVAELAKRAGIEPQPTPEPVAEGAPDASV